jgi:hypothetical protein
MSACANCGHEDGWHGSPERGFGCYQCPKSLLTTILWSMGLGRWYTGHSTCPSFVLSAPRRDA